MPSPFESSKHQLAPVNVLLAVSAALALGCDNTDVTRPQPLPSPVAQVTPLPVSSVVASGYQDPNVPQNTLDNNLGTRWSAFGDGEWIQYDLGAATAVGRVDIAWYQANLNINVIQFPNFMGDGSPKTEHVWVDDLIVWRP
jgi:hypothetical protein